MFITEIHTRIRTTQDLLRNDIDALAYWHFELTDNFSDMVTFPFQLFDYGQCVKI